MTASSHPLFSLDYFCIGFSSITVVALDVCHNFFVVLTLKVPFDSAVPGVSILGSD